MQRAISSHWATLARDKNKPKRCWRPHEKANGSTGKRLCSLLLLLYCSKITSISIKDGGNQFISVPVWDTPCIVLSRDIMDAIRMAYLAYTMTCDDQPIERSVFYPPPDKSGSISPTSRGWVALLVWARSEPSTTDSGCDRRRSCRLRYHAPVWMKTRKMQRIEGKI